MIRSSLVKSLAGRLPLQWQQGLKRLYFRRQIKAKRFNPGEPEYDLLGDWVSPGDWVIDIGANVGHYTVSLSGLVGEKGRVLAMEPIPDTFELLAANVAATGTKNVTLLNVAASDKVFVAGMEIPVWATGAANYYQAHISSKPSSTMVLCLPVDCLRLPQRVKLVKIDAEGHELSVLKGMRELLERDHPVVIVENNDEAVTHYLTPYGYQSRRLPESPNLVFKIQS